MKQNQITQVNISTLIIEAIPPPNVEKDSCVQRNIV